MDEEADGCLFGLQKVLLIMKKSNRAYLGLQTDKKKDKPF
jgi:hypothetical protein